MDLTSSFVTFVLFFLCFVNDYSLLVPTDAHIVLIYISPYLAYTCFSWSPSSGISQPNSLKTAAVNYSLWCYTCKCTYYVKIYNICRVWYMTIDELIVWCFKTVVFFVSYSILPSSFWLCRNIYYDPNRILSLCVMSCKFEVSQCASN